MEWKREEAKWWKRRIGGRNERRTSEKCGDREEREGGDVKGGGGKSKNRERTKISILVARGEGRGGRGQSKEKKRRR